MNIAELQSFLGWMSVINYVLLLFSFSIYCLLRKPIARLYKKLFSIDEQAFYQIYLKTLASYKILVITFNVVPYFAIQSLAA